MDLLSKLKSSTAREFVAEPVEPKSQEFKVTQVFNGYKDAHVFGVVVSFDYKGKGFGAYVDFPAGETYGAELLDIGEDVTDNRVEFPESSGVHELIIEAAKQYVMGYYSR
jgi:hypothetical protein